MRRRPVGEVHNDARRARRAGCLLVALWLSATGVLPAWATPAPPLVLPAIEIVVLVDESGSLAEPDVVREKEAARSVVLSVLAPGSTVSVVGFGSSDRAGQSPLDVVCPPAALDTPEQRDALTTCIGQLHKRAPEEGDHTDHVNALKQALNYLNDGKDVKKIVFLMTDGKLDVTASEAYGRDLGDPGRTGEARNAAARDELPDVLGKLEAAGAQVWPLGFGQADSGELGSFARGTSCTQAAPSPAATIITNPAELSNAILNAYGSATCVDPGKLTPPQNLAPARTVTLTVDIPAIASDSAILVYKRDPRIQVAYFDPNNVQAQSPGTGDSVFQFAGQGTETESLRIIDPVPGTWRVVLTSAPDLSEQEVTARVVYQGAVSARLSVTPPQPAAGQDVDVTMQLRTRRGGVTDPAQLRSLTFVAGLTANGTTSPPLTLTDDDGDGTFGGRLTVPPNATGNLDFTGSVSGLGINGDTQTFSTRVASEAAELQAQLLLRTAGSTVEPGAAIDGEVTVTNTSGQARRLRLVVDDPTPGAVITPDPAVIAAPAGTSTAPFALRFGPDSRLGGTQATLRLVDDADPTTVIADRQFAIDVKPPPSWFDRYWWVLALVALAILAVVAFLLLRLKAARDRRKLRGLKVVLYRSGEKVHELEPPRPDDDVFRFRLHNDQFTAPQLQVAPSDAAPGDLSIFELRRKDAGFTLLPEGPGGRPEMYPGEQRPIGPNLTLMITDRKPSVGTPAAAPAGDGFGATSAPGSWGGPSTSDPWGAQPSGNGWGGGPPAGPPSSDPGPGRAAPTGGDNWGASGDPWGGSGTPSGSSPDPGSPDPASYDPNDPWR